ncbi:hypothetical protein OEZ86_013893 [Tetradesmus obliquus]|nr:hypothetical protein OEZ86_013893 [Tetradesmus obliquus]
MLQAGHTRVCGCSKVAHPALMRPQLLANRRQEKHIVRSSTTAAAEHIILAPPASNSAAAETETLLVLAPGFTVGPADFKHLGEAVQAQCPDVRLWVACMHLDYQGIMAAMMKENSGTSYEQAYQNLPSSGKLEAALDSVKDAAAAAGFKPRQSGWGRLTNLYLCCQSAAGVTLSPVAFKAVAGFILLASTFDGRYSMGKLPSLEDWGRPVMLLGAELDGQMRWPWSAGLAADAAVLAQKAGPRFAAAQQPFILVPGANHGHTSNGIPNYDRGDIPAHTEYATATEAFARAMAAFVTAHEGPGKSAKQAATDQLLLMVRQTAELVAPYFMASGMGNPCAGWITGRQGGPESTASLDAPDTSHSSHQHQHAHGASAHAASSLQQSLLQGARREAGAAVSAALHPGVLQKAERFVAAAQLKLASTLPREVLGKLRVVVQTHTTVEALLFNQPVISEQDDGSVVVLVHALVAPPNVVRPATEGALLTSRASSPEYWLKLKRPQAIAEDLGLSGIYVDGVTAAALNQGAFDAAIAAVNRKAAERYKAAGWQLAFGEDEPTPDVNAEKFIRQGAMKFTAVPAAGSDDGGTADGAVQQQKRQLGVVTVTSPVLTSKSISETVQQAGQGPQAEAMIAATKDKYMHRFLGNWYTKVFSVAQAMEWIMLDSLRNKNTWS